MSVMLGGLAIAAPAQAHDFWLQPRSFNIPVASPDPTIIEVGHGPFRTRWSGALDRVVMFRSVGPGGSIDRRGDLHPNSDRDAVLTFNSPGVHVLAFESTHAVSNLPSIRYNDYIKIEGLTPAIAYRARTHTADTPGREIYSRRCKALIQVGAPGGAQPQLMRPLGLTLEIVPDRNPYTLAPGQVLPVHVLYRGHPLAGALVKLTNLEFDVRPVAMHLTDAAGRTAFDVPRTGDWLINVIWTEPIKGDPNGDFDTTFSSLTFGFAQAAVSRGRR